MLRQIANLLLAVAQIVAALISSMGLIGPTIGELSDQTRSLIVPAGYAFSIWSLLYTGSLVYAVDQVRPQHRNDPLLRRIGWLTASAFMATTLWVLVYPQGWFITSTVIIFWLLASLAGVVAITLRHREHLDVLRHWTVDITFSLFLGWVTIAAAANLASTLVAYGLFDDRQVHLPGGIALLAIAGIGAAIANWRMHGNIPFIVAITWALVAIAIAHWHDARPVVIVAALLILLLIAETGFAYRRKLR